MAMPAPQLSQFNGYDLIDWRENKVLDLSPRFQRRSVWKTPAKAYLLDTILRGMPIPPIIIRQVQRSDNKKVVREVVDGQQRLRALLDYADDVFAAPKSLKNEISEKRFSELKPELQRRIMSYSFAAWVFPGIPDAEVLELFARWNLVSVTLNAQERRNGKFFGPFKQSCYQVAYEYLEYWRRHSVFSEDSIARMREVELTSELLVASLAGQQDKKKSVERYYAEFDEMFPDRTKVEARVRSVLDDIGEAFPETLADSEFSRPPLFYTLFCVAYHAAFGLPNATQRTSRDGRLSATRKKQLHDATTSLSEIVSRSRGEEPIVAERDQPFVLACSRQTDNLHPRKVRFDRLYLEAFLNH